MLPLLSYSGHSNSILSIISIMLYILAVSVPHTTSAVKKVLFSSTLGFASCVKTLQYSTIIAALHKKTHHLYKVTILDFLWIFAIHFVLFNSWLNLIYMGDKKAFNQPSVDTEVAEGDADGEDKGNSGITNTDSFNLFYYSVITSMTIGYGDWYPKSKAAKIAIIFQAVDAYLLFAFLITNFNYLVRNVSLSGIDTDVLGKK